MWKHSWFSGQLLSTKESKQDFDTRPKNLKNPQTESSKARQSSKDNSQQNQEGLAEQDYTRSGT